MKLFDGEISERTTGSRDEQTRHVLWIFAHQALENGTVFRIDGKDRGVVVNGKTLYDLSSDDKCLLVR